MVVQLSDRALARRRSSYTKYLPAIYADSDFMGRFLMIFESILGPIESQIDNIAYYFDPRTTPEELLPWLASWVNMVLDESWPLERRRALVRSAVQLYQWRGTRRGMREYLRVYTGVEPVIEENTGGLPLGANTRLGLNTVLGSGTHHTFSVTLEVDDPDSINVSHVKAIIEIEKPAHTAYVLNIVRRGDDDAHAN
jgi:phage tail-like protein